MAEHLHAIYDSSEQMEAVLLRRYYKIHRACIKLKDALEELDEVNIQLDARSKMRESNSELAKIIASSPTIQLLEDLQKSDKVDTLLRMFQKNRFDSQNADIDKFIQYPVVADPKLEALAFVHKSVPNMYVSLSDNERAMMSNERLEFLGDSWLGALIAYVLYQKYPTANEGTLSQMKEAVVSNENLYVWSEKLGFRERLLGNIPKMTKTIKNRLSKRYADCVEAYIGALVVNRFSTEFEDIATWLEGLASDKILEVENSIIREPFNKSAKSELSSYLAINKLGAKLRYIRQTDTPPFIVEVRLGDILLGTGTGPSIREAEQRAATKALNDTELLQSYSSLTLEDNQSNRYNIEEAHTSLQPTINNITNENAGVLKDSDIENSVEKIMVQVISRLGRSLDEMAQNALEKAIESPKLIEKIQSLSLESDARTTPPKDSSLDHSVPIKYGEPHYTHLESKEYPVSPKPVAQEPVLNAAESMNVFDNRCKAKLYALLSKIQLFPGYETKQVSMNEFYSTCYLKGTQEELGHGTGRSKKIAEQIAAANALENTRVESLIADRS